MENSILTVSGLNVRYGSLHAVQDVSFDVKAGEIFGLLGPNGAGKTSTLSAIEGLLRPQSGQVHIAGYDIRQQPLLAKANMGVQLQSTSFQPELTVAEIVNLYAGLYGVEPQLEKLGEIPPHKKMSELSGGQQQRVSLLITTIHNPKLVLLDEPTTGLDPQSRRNLWEKIEAIRENGNGVVLTTHSMEEAEAVCDRLAIIDHGRVLTIDTPEGLIEKYRDDPEVVSVSRKGKITLEDVFITLTGRAVRF
ncbi:ABC transporter ATP-binding protein [Chitinophaga sancti]|uniref:ABC transporter ATP-binding protein n=1 Tax=Chitinophaga sancti TaxID=1004 RepID=UPI002A74BE46|nr:ABC transporter ATP-binding protein [Chitinophaga sancti]WPQ65158.1 ABC transporter ATP-binding protein [Chitinophaga sancti]